MSYTNRLARLESALAPSAATPPLLLIAHDPPQSGDADASEKHARAMSSNTATNRRPKAPVRSAA